MLLKCVEPLKFLVESKDKTWNGNKEKWMGWFEKGEVVMKSKPDWLDIRYNHYMWLEKYLPAFFEAVGVKWQGNAGIISAHGDKGSTYKRKWAEAGIHYHHGMAIFLLTYCRPYCNEVRETENGWVAPCDWVIKNYDRFKSHLSNEDLGLEEDL